MISSTVDDLQAERQAIEDAIREFRFERFRSESMGSFARSAREVCDEAAASCDVFVLYLGPNYGWTIPELGISVVEREYDVARKQDRGKVLVYVSTTLPDARQRVLINKVTDFTTGYFRARPVASPDELRERVKEDLANWISERVIASGASSANFLSLPPPASVIRGAVGVLTLLVLIIVVTSAASGSDVLIGTRVSVNGVWRVLTDENTPLVLAAVNLTVASLGVTMVGLVIAAVVAAIVLVLRGGQQMTLIAEVLVFAAASWTFLFLPDALPYRAALMAAPISGAAAFLSSLVLRALASHSTEPILRVRLRRTMLDFLLARQLWFVVPVVLVSAFVSDALGHGQQPVFGLIAYARAALNHDAVVAAFAVAFTIAVLCSTAVRVVQASFADEYMASIVGRKRGYEGRLTSR